MTQGELAEKVGVSQSRLSKVEAGALPATDDLIEALARVLDYPREFFFQQDRLCGPSTSEFYHRKRASVGLKVLEKIHAQLNIRRMHLRRLARAAEMPQRVPKLDPDEFNGDIEEIARAVRARWQVPRGPLKSLVELIEDAGGIVLRMRFDTNKVDAVSWWAPGDPPIFAVNEAMPADRERLTLAHELGHLVMHADVRLNMEQEANRFAAALLMPAEDIRGQLRDASVRSLAALKPFWRVSMQALLTRSVQTGAISDGRAKYLWAQLSRAGYRTREPAELDFPKEQPHLLRELFDLHTEQLGYDIKDLAKLLRCHEHDLSANYGRGTSSRLRLVPA